MASLDDVSERQQREEHIRFLAQHDALTGLADRVVFRDRLYQASALFGTPLGAILCLDLHRFKVVNDTLGHSAGDLLLQQVVARVGAHLRAADVFARLGGDEFGIIINGVIGAVEAALIAERIVTAVAVPFVLDGDKAQIGVSIGIALAPQDGRMPDSERLMRCADIALYRAKAEGRSTYRFYTQAMEGKVQQRMHSAREKLRQLRMRRDAGRQLVKPGARHTPAHGLKSAPNPARPAAPLIPANPMLGPA